MTSIATATPIPADDIDLLLLIERALRFSRRYKWLFLAAAVLGLLAGWAMYQYLPKVYKSRMVLHSFLLTNPEQIKIIENWNELLAKKEYTVVASQWNCDSRMLTHVKKISADEIQKVFTPSNPNGFFVDVTVSDNSILESLQTAIVSGLENSSYVHDRLATRRSTLQELIEKTRTEIIKLDSTKHTLENIIAGREKSSSSLIIEGATVNKQLIEMNEKLLSYKDELKFAAAVQVLQGFSRFSRPSGPHLIPWLVIGLAFFLAPAFVIATLINIGRKLKHRLKHPASMSSENT